ncbi:MAG: hypothetical protein FVQ80_07635 [Planctomycetes bacterium]|nr:hypothetical protein [Planctomycetota bacterium]
MKRPIENKILHALVMLLLISIIVYFILRAVSIGFAEYGLMEKTLGVLFFFAEAYVMFHALGYFRGIYTLTRKNVKP